MSKLVERYCINNRISMSDSYYMVDYDIISTTYDINDIIITVHVSLNTIYNVTRYDKTVTHRLLKNGFKCIFISELIRLKRADVLTELLSQNHLIDMESNELLK